MFARLVALSAVVFLAVSPAVASEKVGASDLRRARTRVPRKSYRGSNAAAAATKLNKHLSGTPGLHTAECASFDMPALRKLVQRLHSMAETDLLTFYQKVKDPRAQIATSHEALRSEWAEVDSNLVNADAPLPAIVRDGLCHEAVLRFVHHLTEPTRKALVADSAFSLPLLPPHVHSAPEPKRATEASQAVFKNYENKLSCQQCHSGKEDVDSTVPKPLPVDKEQPGLERIRSCDFQYSPGCGPCEGLGGLRTGDGVHEFTPMKCEVVGTPDQVNASQRVPGVYPTHGTGHIAGDTRWPLVMIPDGHGQYVGEDINVSFGWTDKYARMRYSFNQPYQVAGMKQIYLQTKDQLKSRESTGVTVTITGNGACTCDESSAGVLHLNAFAPHDEWDVIDLPAEQGGIEYLGRVHIPALDDGISNRSVIADHWLKFAFHFLVDADKSSSTYGLPLRSYIPYGVRQVFTSWTLADPEIAEPDMWKMPKDCVMSSDICKLFAEDLAEPSMETVTLV